MPRGLPFEYGAAIGSTESCPPQLLTPGRSEGKVERPRGADPCAISKQAVASDHPVRATVIDGAPVNFRRVALVLFFVLPLQLGLLARVEKRTVYRHPRRITVGSPPMDEGRRSGVQQSGGVAGRNDSSQVGLCYRRVPAEQR